MTHEAPRDDDERPSDATSGVRVTPRPADAQTLDAPKSPDGGGSARLPNWQDREKDQRPGWEKARIPKAEWVRAKASNDAALAREAPGSPEFARLMEARMRLHLGPAPEVDFGEISAYKRSVYQEALAEELRREIAEKERPTRAGLVTGPRIAVVAGLLVVAIVVLVMVILRRGRADVDTTSTATPATATPATAPEGTSTPAPGLKDAPPTTVQPANAPPSSESPRAPDGAAPPPVATTAVAPTTTAKPAQAPTGKPTPAPTAKSGELPFFKPK